MHTPRHAWARFPAFLFVALGIVSAGGCVLPELTPAGAGVRLAGAEAIATCQNLGRVTASVLYKVAGLPRHPDEVQNELNVMARNHAASMGADTIVPASKVEDGKQTFDVYRCLRR